MFLGAVMKDKRTVRVLLKVFLKLDMHVKRLGMSLIGRNKAQWSWEEEKGNVEVL